jgi:hypothetical protein
LPIYFKNRQPFCFSGVDRIRTGVQTYPPQAFYMFIYELIFEKIPERNKPIFSLEDSLKQWAQHTIIAYYFFLMSAAELGSNKACSAALMVTSLSTKQPWHTKYCHLSFSFSDLSANNATHYMLTPAKIYAVKTKTTPFCI